MDDTEKTVDESTDLTDSFEAIILNEQKSQEKMDKLIDLILEEKEQEALQAKAEAEAQAEADAQAELEAQAEAEAQVQLEQEIEEQSLTDAEIAENEQLYKEELLGNLKTMSESTDDSAIFYEQLLQKMDDVILNQEKIIEQQMITTPSDQVMYLYGTIILPAVIIVFLIWKMIKPFLP